MNSSACKRTVRASHQHSNRPLGVRSFSALLFLCCSSSFSFSPTDYWVKVMALGLCFLQLWKIQKLQLKVIVAVVVFGRESKARCFLPLASWSRYCPMVRGVLKLGKRFVKLLLHGAVSCISELNVKYFKSCVILYVVVQQGKDTWITFLFFFLLRAFSSRIFSWLADKSSSQQPGNARTHIFWRSVLLGLF